MAARRLLPNIDIERGQEYTGILLLPNSMGSDDHGAIARALVRFLEEHPEAVPTGYCDFLRDA